MRTKHLLEGTVLGLVLLLTLVLALELAATRTFGGVGCDSRAYWVRGVAICWSEDNHVHMFGRGEFSFDR